MPGGGPKAVGGLVSIRKKTLISGRGITNGKGREATAGHEAFCAPYPIPRPTGSPALGGVTPLGLPGLVVFAPFFVAA